MITILINILLIIFRMFVVIVYGIKKAKKHRSNKTKTEKNYEESNNTSTYVDVYSYYTESERRKAERKKKYEYIKEQIKQKIIEIKNAIELREYERNLKKAQREKEKAKREKKRQEEIAKRAEYDPRLVLPEVDVMSGIQFENYVAVLIKKYGYKIYTTKKSGDFGADIIATSRDERICIQCKRNKNNVGVKAVQEVVSAKQYYSCDRTMVVTNSYFTASAKKLAVATDTELCDRNWLIRAIKKV